MQNTPFSKETDPQPILECTSRSGIANVIQKAKWLLALDRDLQALLPAELAAYCHVMNVNQLTIILGVSSAAIAMRIRTLSSELIQALQKNKKYQNIREIQCKVCARQIRY